MRRLNFLTIISLFLLSSIVHAEPMLNGIASHQDLGKEQFIGALFAESITNNADTLLSANQPMRMELKILSSEGISARRFSRMWIDGMAINNNPEILTKQAPNIVKFDSLFKGRVISGDHIVFQLTRGQGVEVSINSIVLGNIKDDAFFSLLLSSWIGKIPLSSEFKDNMLKVGDVGATLRARFDQIKPASYRSGEIYAWAGTAQPQSSAASSAAKSSIPSIAVNIPPTTTSIDLPPLAPMNDTSSSSSAPSTTTKTTASASSKPKVKDDDNDDSPAFTTESLLARQFYVKEAIKLINKKVRYPTTASQKGQEGSVRITVTLNRQGEIIDIVASSPSEYSALTKEALAAIKRAAPFPALPNTVVGDTFEFAAPIRFTLLQKIKK
ncbi:MAG: TonB family protein [Cellvibrio sp.]|nr:TonB family protein [Cellvibrio sp.]